MVRNIALKRPAALAAAILFSSMMLSGCVADTPRTQLDWYPQGDARPVHVASVHPTPRPHYSPIRTAALDCPTPRSKPSEPGWYTASAIPPAQPANYSPPAGTLSFGWPLSGPVIADYGTTVSGERNDGINIAAPFGTPIRAAAAGQVSYAGNELRGYGNLLLIKHDDGYVTAYAHAERLVVSRGDYVQKGQIIGYAGQTGDVTSPQLHFEIRRGVTPVNPRSLLIASRAS